MRALAARIAVAPEGPVLDVGSGTGIFTRQLAACLPGGVPVLGIEPAAAMRDRAVAETDDPAITYQPGSAECLPAADGSVRAVTAATAAHWFDRPAFYAEAARVLRPDGVLAIVEYVRDEESSAAARAVVAFLARYGEERAYARPDYQAELQALPAFQSVEAVLERAILPLPVEAFVGLALSSSHARHAVEALGRAQAEAMLASIGRDLADESGVIPFGYVFQGFFARR